MRESEKLISRYHFNVQTCRPQVNGLLAASPRENGDTFFKGGSSGSDLAEPGKKFTRKLTVPTGSEVTVQSAPEGLRFDKETGCLLWDVPLNFKSGQTVQVIMLVKPPGAKEEYAIERIAVR